MTAVFFAGGEVETLTRALLDNGVKHILYSFFYIQQMNRYRFIQQMQEEYPDVKWILDSGAFTYWAKVRAEPGKLMRPEEYKRRYYHYIEETWPRWCRIAELDLDNMFAHITEDVLFDWREEMIGRWPSAGIMWVWHGSRGPEEWTLYCRDPRVMHLAIGSGVAYLGMHRRMVMHAHERNKTVHGFAMTKVNTALQSIPYDTVDSTSWLMGQKFGTMFVFQNNRFKLLGKDASLGKKERQLYRRHFQAIGCDWRLIEKDDVAEVRKANILGWRRLSERLQSIRKRQKRSLFDVEDPLNLPILNEAYTFPHGLLRDVGPSEVVGRQRDGVTLSSPGKVRLSGPGDVGLEREEEPARAAGKERETEPEEW